MALDNDEKKFHSMLVALAEQCGFALSTMNVEIYDRTLGPYGYQRVNAALWEIIKARRGGDRFPSVADVLAEMGEIISTKSLAVETANLIFWSFNNWRDKFDDREDFEALYRDRIGGLAFETVSRMGGYKAVYREWKEAGDLSTLRAQVRDSAAACVELARAGGATIQISAAERSVLKLGGKL